MSTYGRRGFLRLAGAAAGSSVLASGCSGSSLGGDSRAPADGPIRIGQIYPTSGVYKVVADDQRAGWDLYLSLHDNKLGGREVQIVKAEESDKVAATKAAAERLVKQEQCTAVSGLINSANLLGIKDTFTEAKVPLICTVAATSKVENQDYIWRTSFFNEDSAIALGGHVATEIDGRVALVAPDYVVGREFVNGFLKTFKPQGGKVAGEPIYTKFPIGGDSYQPYLQQVKRLQAEAVFCFFAGADAVKFVQEYKKFGLSDESQLYAAGYLTEGGVLKAQGPAAKGVRTSMSYAPDLDNPANRTFVSEYRKKHGKSPTTWAVCAYDAAAVLDLAIAAAGDDLSSENIEEQLAALGEIDSPRGAWVFGKYRVPVQQWYLREVRKDGDVLANVVVQELGTVKNEA